MNRTTRLKKQQIPKLDQLYNFDDLDGRPKYGGVEMTSETNIPSFDEIRDETHSMVIAEATARDAADEELQAQIDTLDEGLTAETSARETADAALSTAIATEASARATADTAEETARQTADAGLQAQIDAIVAGSDVKDIVATYAALQQYDKSTLGDNDIIEVLADETHDNATSYYRYAAAIDDFDYIGSVSAGYTKAETDTLLAGKVDKVAGKQLSTEDYTTAEKSKLAGVEAGAQVNIIESVSVNGAAVQPVGKNVDIILPDGVLLLDVDNHTLTADELQAFKDAWDSREPIFIHYGAVGGQIVHPQTGNTLDWTQPQTFSAIINMRSDSHAANNPKLQGASVTFTPSTMNINLSPNNDSILSMEGDSSLSTTAGGNGWVKKSAIQTALAGKADKTAFTGTDGTSAGTMGLVPAPATTDAGKFLKADGSWGEAGGGITELTTEDYDYPTDNPDGVRLWAKPTGIYSLAPGIKVYGANNHNMTMPSTGGLGFVLNPGANQSKYVYYGGSGQLTYLEVNHVGNQAALMTVPIATSDPMAYRVDRALSAAAGYTLQQAIGTLSTLTTTVKTSAVAAINELDAEMPVITMSSTDPGEGTPLAANNFIAYYE